MLTDPGMPRLSAAAGMPTGLAGIPEWSPAERRLAARRIVRDGETRLGVKWPPYMRRQVEAAVLASAGEVLVTELMDSPVGAFGEVREVDVAGLCDRVERELVEWAAMGEDHPGRRPLEGQIIARLIYPDGDEVEAAFVWRRPEGEYQVMGFGVDGLPDRVVRLGELLSNRHQADEALTPPYPECPEADQIVVSVRVGGEWQVFVHPDLPARWGWSG